MRSISKYLFALLFVGSTAWAAPYKQFAADGATDPVTVRGPAHIHADGDFGSGTLTCAYEGQDGAFHNLAGSSYTASADDVLNLPANMLTKVKCTLASSTAPDLYVEIRGAQ